MAEFDHWRTFVRVVECGSFAKAAQQLRIARSAVSRRVSELEADLGVTLLHRNTRSVSLTDVARSVYVRATQLLADFEELEADAAGRTATFEGLIRLAAPLSFTLAHVQSTLEQFRHEHPEVCFDLHLGDRRVDIVGEAFDFALRIGAEMDGSMVARRLCTIDHMVLATPDYLDRHGTPVTPDQLRDHKALCYANWRKPKVWSCWTHGGQHLEVPVNPAIICDNGDVLLAAAIAGDGIMCGPTFLSYQAIADGRLVPLLTDWRWSEMSAFLVFPPNRRIPRRVRALMDTLVSSLSDPTPWDTVIARRLQPQAMAA
jgi:DNA-binding transcriptional LysR family regulator